MTGIIQNSQETQVPRLQCQKTKPIYLLTIFETLGHRINPPPHLPSPGHTLLIYALSDCSLSGFNAFDQQKTNLPVKERSISLLG